MKELNVEDLLFNEEKQESDYLELPLSQRTFLLVGGVVLLTALIAFGRSAYINTVNGAFYSDRAAANLHSEVELPAPRGIIKDRFGNPLVENQNSFSAFLNVADLLKRTDDWMPLVKEIADALGLNLDDLESFVRKANLEKQNFIPLARNITRSQTIALNSLNMPELAITSDYARSYINAPAFSHVLGYVGETEASKDLVGQAGLEAYYDSILRGADGRLFVYRDAKGKILDKKVDQAPKAGNDLVVTLDADLQKYFYDRMKAALANLGREAGAGVVMDPRNGEVLAMVSLPSFDNNNVSKYLTGHGQPLFNRVVSGVYTPGSTIKPLVALAALREQIVAPDFQILSTGSIELPNPYDPEHPSKFLDWRPQGWVDIHSALARSSNVYFYEVGGGFQGLKGLGIERLRQYWQTFLLGQKTGIDLPTEKSGFLPAPDEKEKRTGQIWRIGDTYNVSIGQGDLQLTPLQLINFISSVANGGKIYQPHLARNQNDPVILFDYSGWQDELKEVRQGMDDAVDKPYGTANMLSGLPISAAAKTGSSQVANNTRTNAFFVGYAPQEDPEIAVLVLIENSKEGSLNAVPVARDVMQWYYDNRIVNHKDNL